MEQYEDYIATHCKKDKLTFLAMALVSGALMAFFLLYSKGLFAICLCAVISCLCAYWAYVFFVSSVRFSREQIQVTVPPFLNYSKYYGDIESLRTQRGNLKVRFAGGKILNLPSGLGNAEKIASILKKKVDIIPDGGGWQ
jgi:hypothetical protein